MNASFQVKFPVLQAWLDTKLLHKNVDSSALKF